MIRSRLALTTSLALASFAGCAAGQFTDDRLCADVNLDGFVTPSDFGAWVAAYNSGNQLADVNQDGTVAPTDFGAWVAAYNQGSTGPGCAVDIGGGGTVNGSISFAGDVDGFQITARAGDDILITIAEDVPTNAELRLTLTSPNGTVVGTSWGYINQRFDVLDVPSDGTYLLTVREYYDEELADYTMTVVVADDSIDIGNTPLVSGLTRNATMTPGDIDTFSIEARAGDDLLLTMSEASASEGELIVTVHGPNGELLASKWAYVNMRLDVADVPADGTYTFVVRDYYGAGTGDYRLTAVVTDGLLNADNTGLASGQTVSRSLEPGDIDTFSINAQAGDDLIVTISETPAVDAELFISIHGPNGELLHAEWDYSSMRVDLIDVPADGNYTVVVREYYGGDSIDYTLTALVANGGIASDNTALVSGGTVTAALTPGDVDTFTISAQGGDDLIIAISETPAVNGELFISIHGPNGELLHAEWDYSSMRVDLIDVPADGNYTVVVREYYGGDSIDYTLTAVVADGSTDAGNVALSSGSAVTATMSPGDIDTYTISAAFGQDLSVFTTETPTSGMALFVSIHAPSGQRIRSGWAYGDQTLTSLNVAASGTYTIVVRDYDGGETGDFSITATVTN